MINNNRYLYFGKILGEIFFDFAYFPLWWYSHGLFFLSKKLFEFLGNRQKSLSLFVWIKNIFTPMYAQSDWQGRLISFFIRVVQIVFRTIVMFIWIAVAISIVFIWLLLPYLAFSRLLFFISS